MPVPILYILIVVSIIFFIGKKRSYGYVFMLLAGLWFIIISTNVIPCWLTANLENRYVQVPDSALKKYSAFNIIVLGAGFSDDISLVPNNQLSREALGRLVEGVRVFKKAKGDRQKPTGNNLDYNINLIVSGEKGEFKISQAEVLKKTAIILGVDSSNIGMLTKTVNTRNEAEEYVRNYGIGKKLVLVTDAIHMPRAVNIFTYAGITVIPAPANFVVKHGSVQNFWRWIPSAENIKMMEAAMHEYIGMLWYVLGGR